MRLAVPLVRKAATSASASGPATTALLKVGDALRSGRRRFTEADVAAYAAVSGDRNPVHLDDAFARGAGGFARGRVVHGMLAASLFPALIASRFVRIPIPSPPLHSLWGIPPNTLQA
jgi:acyl dehydratase